MSEQTEFADVQFKASEFGDGSCFLSTTENGPSTNTILNETTNLTLLLKEGTSLTEAQALASYINARVQKVGLRFPVR